ncbi:MAG: hypothetical protein ACI4QP_04715 [Candidatus Enteromonas sp.]
MNFLTFAAIILGVFFLSVLALRISVYFKERQNKGRFQKIKEVFFGSLLIPVISFLIIISFLYLAFKNPVRPCILLLVPLFYTISTFFVKLLTTYLIVKKTNCGFKNDTNLEKKKSETVVFWLFQLDCVSFSPDYCFTYICKNFLFGFKKEDEIRSKLIKCFNIENIFLSGLFGIDLACLFCFTQNSLFFECFLFLTGVRFISRSMEIMISFVKDIIDKKKLSGLNAFDRIGLAFNSMFEVFLLSFCIFFCQTNGDFLAALLNSLSLVNGSWTPGEIISGFDVIKVFESLTCFSLVGLVIGSYISGKKTICAKAIEEAPQLFVMDENGVRNTIAFVKSDEDWHWKLILTNKIGCSYVVNDRGKYCHLSSKDYENMPFAERAEIQENFVLKGEVFEIDFDENTKEITILKEDKENEE